MRGALMHNCGMSSLGGRVLVGRLGGAGKRKQSSPVLAGSRVYRTSRALALFSGLGGSADHYLISYDRRCRIQLSVMHSCCLRNTYDTPTKKFMQRADASKPCRAGDRPVLLSFCSFATHKDEPRGPLPSRTSSIITLLLGKMQAGGIASGSAACFHSSR